MGEPDVAIGESELNRIGEYVQSHLTGWMEQLGLRPRPDPVTNTQLLERVVRVEEELKRFDASRRDGLQAGREIMITKFDASDARIGELIRTTGNRFAAMDDRFTAQAKTMDDRFNDLRQSIGTVKWFIVTSFVVIGSVISLLAFLQ